MAKFVIQNTTLQNIADEVREIAGVDETLSPSEMIENLDGANIAIQTEADLINQIRVSLNGKAAGGEGVTLPELSNPADTSKVLSGYEFIDEQGEKVTGTIPSKAQTTYTPSTSDQIIEAGIYLEGAQTILGDADLVAGNIKKGVNIFGVNGSYDAVELNFEVVGGTTAPASPKENTIWVNTSTGITGWYFSATQPKNIVEGEVWFATGNSSEAAFEALEKNGIRVYPLECKQMISGELKGVAFTIYQNGAWVEWWNGQLYDSGNEYTFVTGGWQARGLKVDSGNNAAAPTIVKGSNHVTISQSSYACGGVYEIVKDFDLTEFNTLTFDVVVGSETGVLGLIVYDRSITSTGNNSGYFSKTLAYKQLQPGSSGSFNIDVSGVNKAACIGIAVYNWVAAVTPYVTMKKAFVS